MRKFLILVALISAMCTTVSAQKVPIKYHGEVDLGYSLGVGTLSTNRVNLHTIHGAKFGKYFSLGLGIGLDYYHEMYEKGELIVPVFVDAKGYLPVNKKFSPYVSMDLGYGIGATLGVEGLGGLMWSPAVGFKYNKFKFQIGYHSQELSEYGIGLKMNAIQVKLGLMF